MQANQDGSRLSIACMLCWIIAGGQNPTPSGTYRNSTSLHLLALGRKPQNPDLQSSKAAIQATVMLIALRTVRAMVMVMTVLPARVNHWQLHQQTRMFSGCGICHHCMHVNHTVIITLPCCREGFGSIGLHVSGLLSEADLIAKGHDSPFCHTVMPSAS